MQTDPDPHVKGAEEFGRAFALLMARLTREYDSLAAAAGEPAELERIRREVATGFALEAEELIARHHVADTVAEYVRHVVREGYDVDFDPMDPTEESLRARGRPAPAACWIAAAPTEPGAYAVRPPGQQGPVELAYFDLSEGSWRVALWRVPGAAHWSDLERQGWRRWAVATRTPPA